jgi:hypothetical protein
MAKKTDDQSLEQFKTQLKAELREEVRKDAQMAKMLVASDAATELGIVRGARADELKVLAAALAESLKSSAPTPTTANDQDSAIKVFGVQLDNIDKKFTEKFAEVKADIKEIKDGTANRIDRLETVKLDIKDSYGELYKENVDSRLDSHSGKITKISESLVGYRNWGAGLFFASGIITALVTYIYFSGINNLKEDVSKHEIETQRSFQSLIK